jgi:hypothetical protein
MASTPAAFRHNLSHRRSISDCEKMLTGGRFHQLQADVGALSSSQGVT